MRNENAPNDEQNRPAVGGPVERMVRRGERRERTMKVRELVQWLAAFEDQDAEVEVVQHSSGSGYYEQGGTASVVKFDPAEHADYTDLRGNPHIKPDAPYFEARTLLLGEMNA